MSRSLFPGPYNDYSGVIREVLGDEYAVVMAVFKALPELRQMVKDVHDGAKEAIGNTTQDAIKQVDAGLADAQKKLSDQLDCINKEFNDRNDAVILSLRKSITDQVNNYRTQMDGWASTLIDSMSQSQQPIIDEAEAAIEQAKEARVAELATALQDTATQHIADVNAAGNTMIGQIKAAQSNIQVLQYTNTADDISQAPKPSDVTAPAILFFTLNQGKPANVFRAYIWNTVNQSWCTKALEMDQPRSEEHTSELQSLV